MKFSAITRFLLLTSLILSWMGSPAPIQAADRAGSADTPIYLPLILKPGSSQSSGMLDNSGVVEGPDGVGIGALADTLQAPIQVSITLTAPPSLTLPTDAQVLGNYYQIGAGENTTVPTDSPFILAFPVPGGADTAHLALAVLQSGEGFADVPEANPTWTLLEGMVDPVQGLFLTTIAGLRQAGEVFTLVEHPDFDSPPNTPPNALSGSGGGQGVQFDLFTVHCLYFAGSTNCTDATEAAVAAYLTDIFDHIHQDLGFNEPRLLYMNESLQYSPNSLSSLGYTTYIEPVNHGLVQGGCKPDVDGYYTADLGRLVLCYDPITGLTEDSLHTLIHEYFHATQHAYPKYLEDHDSGDEEIWLREGMAASAEESYFVDEMLRSNAWPDLHAADVSLKSEYELDEYMAQDFWVYFGQVGDLDLSYMKQFLELGASSKALVDILDDPRDQYLNVYWDWVKNHVMEPEINYEGKLGTPCELETDVVLAPEEVSIGFYSNLFYDVPLLDPLSSIVVDLRWDWDGYTIADGNVFPVPGQDPMADGALRYKFYEEGELFCQTVPDGHRLFQNLDPQKRYYLVISNVDHDSSWTYRIRFEIGPVPPPP